MDARPYEIEAMSSCGWEPHGNLHGSPKVEGLPRRLGTMKAGDMDGPVVEKIEDRACISVDYVP